MLDVPSVIRVGVVDINIEPYAIHEAGIAGRFAEWVPIRFAVRYDSTISSKWKLVETILHELGHVIFWAYGLEDKNDEERTVTMMGLGWTQVFRDNPQLLEWIQSC